MVFLPSDVEPTSEILLTPNSESITPGEQIGGTNDTNICREVVVENINRSNIIEIEPRAEINQKLSTNRMKPNQEEKENEDLSQNSKRYYIFTVMSHNA